VLSVPFAALFTYFVWMGRVVDAVPFLVASAALDALDGAVARKVGKATKGGAFLDSAIDRVNDVIIFYSLPALGVPWPVAYFWITGSLLVSLVRAAAEREGISLAGKGMMERGDRILALLMLIALYSAEIRFYPIKDFRYVPGLAAGVAALIWLTVLQRIYLTRSSFAAWTGLNAASVVVLLFAYGWWDPLGTLGVSGGLSSAYLIFRYLSLGGKFPMGIVDALTDSLILLTFIFMKGIPSWLLFTVRTARYFRELRKART